MVETAQVSQWVHDLDLSVSKFKQFTFAVKLVTSFRLLQVYGFPHCSTVRCGLINLLLGGFLKLVEYSKFKYINTK